MKYDVVATAGRVGEKSVAGKTVVVLDILRATSTIVTALCSGCREIIPVETIAEAMDAVQKQPDVLLGGERDSLTISGFDLGNSPLEYTKENVAGKTVVITTTNGTRAIRRAVQGKGDVLIGSLLNAGAVAEAALVKGKETVIVCAGTRGEFSLEDIVAAGIIIKELEEKSGERMPGSDLAVAARRLGEVYATKPLQALYDSLHGQKLAAMGLAKDLEWCARLNSFKLVPTCINGRIRIQPI